METLILTIGLFFIGAILGSFVVATTWRLRLMELKALQAEGEKLTSDDKKLLKAFKSSNQKMFSRKDRSICFDCHQPLKWYDMLPVVSWLFLKGKCRQCRQPIGQYEFWLEIGLGVVVALSYLVWPYGLETAVEFILFGLWIVALVLLAIEFSYDVKWLLIPRLITWMLLVVAVIYAGVYFFGVYGATANLMGDYLIQIGLSLLALPGFYLLLYIISKKQWVGWGDIELLIPMAIMVAAWPSAILLIFLANFIGCIVVLPGLLLKKLGRMSRIPFGPFLVLAFVVTMLWGADILDIYVGSLLFKP